MRSKNRTCASPLPAPKMASTYASVSRMCGGLLMVTSTSLCAGQQRKLADDQVRGARQHPDQRVGDVRRAQPNRHLLANLVAGAREAFDLVVNGGIDQAGC